MKKLKIIALFSGGASALQYLLAKDPNWGKSYEIVCAIANKNNTKGEKFCKENGINFLSLNTKNFCIKNGYNGLLNAMPENLRQYYYAELLRCIKPFEPDLILLSGFMLRINGPLLGYCPIVNVHPSDLRIKDIAQKPKYTGASAVELAINDGQTFTASTIHVVEEEVDCGKIICVSDKLHVEEGCPAYRHQDKMKMLCDGPAYKKALELICSGKFAF